MALFACVLDDGKAKLFTCSSSCSFQSARDAMTRLSLIGGHGTVQIDGTPRPMMKQSVGTSTVIVCGRDESSEAYTKAASVLRFAALLMHRNTPMADALTRLTLALELDSAAEGLAGDIDSPVASRMVESEVALQGSRPPSSGWGGPAPAPPTAGGRGLEFLDRTRQGAGVLATPFEVDVGALRRLGSARDISDNQPRAISQLLNASSARALVTTAPQSDAAASTTPAPVVNERVNGFESKEQGEEREPLVVSGAIDEELSYEQLGTTLVRLKIEGTISVAIVSGGGGESTQAATALGDSDKTPARPSFRITCGNL